MAYKKLLIFIILGIMITLGYFAYQIGMDYASEKIMNEITKEGLPKEEIEKLMQDPNIQSIIKKQIEIQHSNKEENNSKNNLVEQVNMNNPMVVSSKEEALTLILSKYNMKEIQSLVGLTKDGLTSEEKQEIQTSIQMRLSQDEYESLLLLGLIEISKNSE